MKLTLKIFLELARTCGIVVDLARVDTLDVCVVLDAAYILGLIPKYSFVHTDDSPWYEDITHVWLTFDSAEQETAFTLRFA